MICEILNEDGRTMKRDELDAFAASHGLTFITVSDLVAHRLTNERLVHRAAEARLPNDLGGDGWRIVGYRNDVDDREHVALVYGDLGDGTMFWSACTPSASRATSSTRDAAIAAGSCTRRWR